jgi:cytochrome bd-type quinol oxidase subunit 2
MIAQLIGLSILSALLALGLCAALGYTWSTSQFCARRLYPFYHVAAAFAILTLALAEFGFIAAALCIGGTPAFFNFDLWRWLILFLAACCPVLTIPTAVIRDRWDRTSYTAAKVALPGLETLFEHYPWVRRPLTNRQLLANARQSVQTLFFLLGNLLAPFLMVRHVIVMFDDLAWRKFMSQVRTLRSIRKCRAESD